MKISGNTTQVQSVCTEEPKTKKKSNFLSILAGYGACTAVTFGSEKMSSFAYNKFSTSLDNAQKTGLYTPERSISLFEASGLAQKGCRLNNFSETEFPNLEHRLGFIDNFNNKMKDYYEKSISKARLQDKVKAVIKNEKALEKLQDEGVKMKIVEKMSWKLNGCNYSSSNIKSLYSNIKQELIEQGVENPSEKEIADIAKRISATIKTFSRYKKKGGAVFLPAFNDINLNLNNSGVVLAHELGHAKTFNSGILSKVWTYVSAFAPRVAPIALLAAILCKPKEKRDKDQGFIGKTFGFIKDNAVAISAISLTPQLLEEGMASVKGYNIAKKVLPKEALKHLPKAYGTAFLTYAVAALGTVLATFAADKARNATC